MARALLSTKIYNDLGDLFEEIITVTDSMPHNCKFTIGERMHQISIDLAKSFISAYQCANNDIKLSYLNTFEDDMATLVFIITAARNNRLLFGNRRIGHLVASVAQLQKQVAAYKKSIAVRNPQ
jgi:hypothetical protein